MPRAPPPHLPAVLQVAAHRPIECLATAADLRHPARSALAPPRRAALSCGSRAHAWLKRGLWSQKVIKHTTGCRPQPFRANCCRSLPSALPPRSWHISIESGAAVQLQQLAGGPLAMQDQTCSSKTSQHSCQHATHGGASSAAARALGVRGRRRCGWRAFLAPAHCHAIHRRGLPILVTLPAPLCSGSVADHQQPCRQARGLWI